MLKIFAQISQQSLPVVTPTEIVCGDCAGDELLPIRTKLTGDGRCAVCGGRSYEIASRICEALARHLQKIKIHTIHTQDKNYEQHDQNDETTANFRRIE